MTTASTLIISQSLIVTYIISTPAPENGSSASLCPLLSSSPLLLMTNFFSIDIWPILLSSLTDAC